MTGRNRLNSDSNSDLLIDLGTYINSLSCSLIHVTGMATLFPQMATTMSRMGSRNSSSQHNHRTYFAPNRFTSSVLAVIDLRSNERSEYSYNTDIAHVGLNIPLLPHTMET